VEGSKAGALTHRAQSQAVPGEPRTEHDGPPWSIEDWLAKVPAISYVRWFDGARRPVTASIFQIGDKVESWLGYERDEFLKDPNLWTARIHEDDVTRVLAAWRRTNQSGGRSQLTYRMLARDGYLLRVVDHAEIVQEAGTGGSWWFGFVVDVTDDDPKGSALREAEAKYRRLVEQIPTAIYIDEVSTDDPSDLIPAYVSPHIQRLLGYTPEEWVADPDLWDKSAHPDDVDATNTEAARAYKAGDPLSIEYRMIARDGRIVWVREEATLFRDVNRAPKFWQGVYIDITELKRSEERLQEALAREREASDGLRALDEMKNTFLEAVSHDLRTPLAAIMGLAMTLEREDLELDDAGKRDMASRIANNSRKLESVVTDLLDLDRLTRGIVSPNLVQADVGSLVREAVDQFEALRGRDVSFDIEAVTVAVDPPKLERILENLLANTVRHTPGGARIWVRTRAQDGGALITVEDEGPGVPRSLHEAVFEPFRQGPSQSSHAPGAGIGLALVARFAELHGGRAWVEDRPGGGASFHVFLPTG
jgi:PAS domain S-box-containing protein